MREISELFESLQRSKFRTGFRLNAKDQRYLQQKGLSVVLDHAE
jgi:hypothetical protein